MSAMNSSNTLQPDSEVIVSVRNLTHRYRKSDAPVLSDVSFDLKRGSCVGLLGPNGAGKSTLIELLNGAMPTQSGAVLIDGKPLRKQRRQLKDISAYAPQNLAFHPRLSVIENLQYFAVASRSKKMPTRDRLDESIRICDLSGNISARAGFLSGGLKRRLNLAISLLSAPQILYLDEPTVGIDAESRETIVKAISEINRAGTTVVYTSHYFEEVEAICSDIIILRSGQVVFRGGQAQMKTRADGGAHMYFQRPLTTPEIQFLTGVGATITGPSGARIPHKDFGPFVETLKMMSGAGLAVDRMDYGGARLEDVYLQYLGS